MNHLEKCVQRLICIVWKISEMQFVNKVKMAYENFVLLLKELFSKVNFTQAPQENVQQGHQPEAWEA